jgi:potassium/hydrogen antiporter
VPPGGVALVVALLIAVLPFVPATLRPPIGQLALAGGRHVAHSDPGKAAATAEGHAVDHTLTFGMLVALVGAALLLAIFSSRISDAIGVPAPAIFLIAAAVASDLFPVLYGLSVRQVQDIVTVALIFILFEGGIHIGWRNFRSALGPIAAVGILGTFLTAAAVALLAHLIFGFGWQASLLIGAALAPTDPAAVFSVLGKQEISGRSGTIIEGESGANDPVGIALVASLLVVVDTGATGLHAIGEGLRAFLLQMGIGAAVGLVLGYLLAFLVRRVPLPTDALYPLRTIAAAAAIYGIATVAHGSGFLAVFIAGIMLGNVSAPYKGETRRVLASVASLGEIVAFAVLGLTINLTDLMASHAWWIGLILAALLTLVVRPLLVGTLLLPVALRPREKIFVLWSGLKGAVPILLGTFVFVAAIPDARLIYNIIFVVVLFSVVVQGGLVPLVAGWSGVRMEPVEPEP